MESSPSSRLGFFDEIGALIPCPIEGRKCGIAINVPKELWPSIILRVGAIIFPVRLDEGASFAYAEWPPSVPGQYEITLVCGDIRERRSFTVLPRSFDENDCVAIMHELTDVLPKSIAIKLNECGARLGTNFSLNQNPTTEDEFLRLRLALRGTKDRLGLLQLLPIIQRDCYQILLPRIEIRKSKKLRRPVISKIPQAITMPGNLSASNELYQMFDMTVDSSFETYENRLVKGYVQAVRSRLSRLQTQLASEAAPPAMASELLALIAEFNLVCGRASFLREVRLPAVSVGRVTMVLLKNPAYRAVLEDYLALFEQSTVTLEEPAINAPLNNFPYLYQLWANLNVLNAMLQVCAEKGFRCISHPWVKRFNKGVFFQIINDGKAGIELSCPTTGRLVSLIPWTPGGQNASGAPRQELRMAVAVGIFAPERTPVVLLFDPKYKVNYKSDSKAAKKARSRARRKGLTKTLSEIDQGDRDDIEPMPEDIDELRRCMELVKGPGGNREIQYAALLYPGLRKQIAPDLEALPAHPSDRDRLQSIICDLLRRYLV